MSSFPSRLPRNLVPRIRPLFFARSFGSLGKFGQNSQASQNNARKAQNQSQNWDRSGARQRGSSQSAMSRAGTGSSNSSLDPSKGWLSGSSAGSGQKPSIFGDPEDSYMDRGAGALEEGFNRARDYLEKGKSLFISSDLDRTGDIFRKTRDF